MHLYNDIYITLCIVRKITCFVVFQALGSGFAQFSQPVFQRCLDIIHTQQLAKVVDTKFYCFMNHSCHIQLLIKSGVFFFLQVDPATAGVQFDKEFVVCSLDLLSGLTEGLGSGIESLVFIFPHNEFHKFLNCRNLIIV